MAALSGRGSGVAIRHAFSELRTAAGGAWPRSLTTALSLLLTVAACLAVQLRLGDGSVTDPFHEGEYFAYFETVHAAAFEGHALSLHGALDYLPAAIAHAIGAPQHFVFWTMVVNAAFGVATNVAFVLAAATMLRTSVFRYPLLPAAAVLAPMMMTARDLFAALAIWLVASLLLAPSPRRILRIANQIGLGLCLGIGFYWSFDRGLSQAVGIGGPLVLAAVTKRRFWPVIAIWIATILVLGFTTDAFSLPGYIANLRFIAIVSSQFSYGLDRDAVLLTIGGLVFTVAAMLLVWRTIKADAAYDEQVLALILVVFGACVFKTLSYRADTQHFAMMMWMPALAVLYAVERLRDGPEGWLATVLTGTTAVCAAVLAMAFWQHKLPVFIACGLFSGLMMMVASERRGSLSGPALASSHVIVAIAAMGLLYVCYGGLADGGYRWMHKLVNPPPNETLVSKDVVWVTHRLREHHVDCLMDLSNHGIVNGVLDLPSCTRVTYPVYATATYQDEMIAALEARPVAAVVYSSTHWAYSIDGIPMRVRLPKLDAYLVAHYSSLECGPGYCIRSRS